MYTIIISLPCICIKCNDDKHIASASYTIIIIIIVIILILSTVSLGSGKKEGNSLDIDELDGRYI